MHKFLWSESWKRVTRCSFYFLHWDFSCELWPSSRCFLYGMIRKQYLAEPMDYNPYPSPGGLSFCITSWHLNSFVACQGSTRECFSDKGRSLYDFYGLYALRILCPILQSHNTVGSFDMILKKLSIPRGWASGPVSWGFESLPSQALRVPLCEGYTRKKSTAQCIRL